MILYLKSTVSVSFTRRTMCCRIGSCSLKITPCYISTVKKFKVILITPEPCCVTLMVRNMDQIPKFSDVQII